MKLHRVTWILLLVFTLGLLGCSQQAGDSAAEGESGQTADSASSGTRASQPRPQPIVLPAGTEMDVRLITGLSSKDNQDGDPFQGTVEENVVVDGKVAIPKDADIEGKVTKAVESGRFKGRAELWVTLTSVKFKGKSYQLATDTVGQQEGSKTARNILFIGGGAGGGAAIGGATGGGKGAATGSAIGAAAGTAAALLTGKRDIQFPSETLLRFKLEEELRIQP